MTTIPTQSLWLAQFPQMLAMLPGPDRHRAPAPYVYRLTYRNPDHASTGCVQLWSVRGGRQYYQIAIERDEQGRLLPHCTCADAVYRGELDHKHICKHVRGWLQLGSDPTREKLSA